MRISSLLLILIVAALMGCRHRDTSDNEKYVEPESFNVKYITASDSTGLLMGEDEFWKLIEESRIASKNNYQLQIKSLQGILLKIDTSNIVKFHNTFTALLAGSYNSKLWGASYVINGGCSDDCFEYFREYLIAHGKYRFYSTLKDPESCAPWIKADYEENWEGIRYAAPHAYKQKAGKDIPQYYQPEYKLKGEIFDEATVFKQYPRLAEIF